MSDVKVSELTSAATVSADDYLLLTKDNGGVYSSTKAKAKAVAAKCFKDATNKTVATTAWSEQGTPDFAGYPYVATISITGVTTSDIAEVIPSLAAINDGKLCPLNKTVTDGVNIYASEVPSSNYTIERISIREANA